MKVARRSVRKDSEQEHIHVLPDGTSTMGPLTKPSQSTQFSMHTHLYQNNGTTYETDQAFDEPGHTHETVEGMTKGPKAPPAKESFGPRND